MKPNRFFACARTCSTGTATAAGLSPGVTPSRVMKRLHTTGLPLLPPKNAKRRAQENTLISALVMELFYERRYNDR